MITFSQRTSFMFSQRVRCRIILYPLAFVKLSVNADSRVRERDIADCTSEYLLWPEHCADVSAALNVVFKLINSEFFIGNYILEQIADGNNADHFCVFDYGQMTHALLGHQGHA